MSAVVLFAVFLPPVAAGAGWGGWVWLRDRRRLAAAFARGRAESVVRLPATVEPLPTFTTLEVVA